MKTRKWGSLYPPRTEHLSGKFAAFLATMLLLLAPASVMADDALYIVKVVDDGKTLIEGGKKLIFTANDDATTINNETCWTLDTWMTNGSNSGAQNLESDIKKAITTVSFEKSFANARPTKTKYWFGNMTNLVDIEGLENLNTSEVTNMSQMFYYCKKLTTLDLSKFNTDKVTDMGCMFQFCEELNTLDLSNFNTENVTDMHYMFAYCYKQTSIDLSHFNTKKVMYMNGMFSDCIDLTDIKFGVNFNTDNVTNMLAMFYACKKLKTLDLSKFNTEKVTDMSNMFNSCCMLESLNLSSFNTSKVTNMHDMFYNCNNLSELNLSSFNTEKVTNMYQMFCNCNNLSELNLSSFNTEKVTDMYQMFCNCNNLSELNLSSFNTEKVTDMYKMFSGCKKITTIDLSGFNTKEVTDMRQMFSECNMLASLNLSSFNTTNVDNMRMMFSECTELQDITFGENFKTANVWNMAYMFYNCNKLNAPIFDENFKTDNVEDLKYMFNGCKAFTTLDLSKFNTSKVEDMQYMFYECENITSLNISNFNTSKVEDMNNMFCYCNKLKALTFGENFKTDNVTNMSNMFYQCENLTSLDLSGFNTTKVTNMSYMFSRCTALKSLNLGNNYFKNATSTSDAFNHVSGCKLTVDAGFDVSVLGTANAGIYTWKSGKFILQQLTLNEDNADEFVAATESGTAYNTVVLKRTFNDNAWNTLVVPFDISDTEAKEAFGNNVQIAKYTGTTTNNNASEDGYEYVLNFETSTDGITANEPVFIYGVKTTSDNYYTFTGENTINVIKGTPTKTDDNINFVGTYTTGYVPQGNYFIDSHNKIYRAANDNTNAIKATRATFAPVSANNEAKIASFVIGGETTGIKLPTTVNRVADGAVYNLQGQRVGPNYKGVVIQQGKKYLRK